MIELIGAIVLLVALYWAIVRGHDDDDAFDETIGEAGGTDCNPSDASRRHSSVK